MEVRGGRGGGRFTPSSAAVRASSSIHLSVPFSRAPQVLWETSLDPTQSWMDATFVPALEGVCCVSSAGVLLRVGADVPELEPVGDFPTGILAICWSPDLEIVAILTGEGNLVTMTASWTVRFSPCDIRRPAGPLVCLCARLHVTMCVSIVCVSV